VCRGPRVHRWRDDWVGGEGCRKVVTPPFQRSSADLRRLVDLGFSAAGLGGDDGWGYNHSDESQGNQNIMHGSDLLCGVRLNFSTP